MGTAVAEPALSSTLSNGGGLQVPVAPQGFPTSDLDQRIFQVPDGSAQYYAVAPGFVVLFHLPINPPLVTVVGSESVVTVSPRPLDPSTVRVEIHLNQITYDDFFGPGLDLVYTVAVNGLKEVVVVESPEALKGAPPFSAEIAVNDEQPRTLGDDPFLEFERTTSGEIPLGTSDSRPEFYVPAGIAIPADEATRGTLESPVRVRPFGDRTIFSLEVTEAMYALPASAFPLLLDPSIDPVSGTVTIQDQTVLQEAPLVVLNGGILTLINVDLIFNASSLYIDVRSGGQLSLQASYIGTNGSYGFNGTIAGLVSASGTTFDKLSGDGLEIKNSGTGNFDGCTFLYGTIGVKVTAAGAAGHIQTSTFDHMGTGVWVTGPFMLNGFAIQFNTFNDGEIGIMVTLANITGSSVTQNAFTDLETVGVWVTGNGANAAISSNTFTRNYKGISVEGAATLTANGDTLLNNSFGVTVFSATATLVGLTMGNDNVDLYDDGSTVTIIGGNFLTWVTDHRAGWTTIGHLVNFHVLNSDGTPAASLLVTLTDSGGRQESSGTTDANGNVYNLTATEYTTDGTTYGFFTPHQITAGSTSVHAVLDLDKTWTIYRSGDADNDSIADTVEDKWRDVTWLDLDGRAANYSFQHVDDFNASDGSALRHEATSYTFIQPTHTPPVRPGSYRLVVRARSLVPDQILNVTVGNETGTTLVTNTFSLDSEYRFFTTDYFTIVNYQKLRPQFTDASQGPPGLMLVDRFALVRYLDDDAAMTPAQPGRVTDPLVADTDYDTADDGLELFSSVYWYEAERVNASSVRVQATNASNSWALTHTSGSTLVVNASLPALGYSNNTSVEAWVRVRCATGSSCDVPITIENNGTAVNVTRTVGAGWSWVNSSRLTLGIGGYPLNITIEDATDQDLSDATSYVLVDRFTIAATASYPTPTFYLTDPLDSDLDRDELYDGHEIKDFFTKDKAEWERGNDSLGFDTGLWGIVTANNTNLGVDYDDRYASVNFTTDRDAEWRTTIVGGFAVYHGDLDGIQPYLPHAFNITVTNASNESQSFSLLTANDFRQKRGDLVNTGGITYPNHTITQQRSYILPAGSYRVNITLNMTLLEYIWTNMPYAQYGQWVATLDYVLIQRKVLDPFDPDSEDDNVTDGVENVRGSYPLNNDSERDNVSDWEEIYPGVDGRSTNPVSNDTDGDSLADWTEIFGPRPTNATNWDTDGDLLPDGWIDGYHYLTQTVEYRSDDWFKDGIRQAWEGEDLNADGQLGGGGFAYDSGTGASTGGETDPLDMDSDDDSIDDGWEVRFKGYYSGSVPAMLDPLSASNASVDIDADGLTNFQEYNFDTDPYRADTDGDNIRDGDELRIEFRTSIAAGAASTIHYNESTANTWAYADVNPYDTATGQVYWYQGKTDNATLETRQMMGSFETGQEPYAAGNTTLDSLKDQMQAEPVAFRTQKENGTYPYGDYFFKFEGNDTGVGNSYAYYLVFDVDIAVTTETHLQWKSFVARAPTSEGQISLEIKFTNAVNGDWYARDLGIQDADGNYLHPNLHRNQIGVWESFDYNLSVANGRTIDKIAIAYDDKVETLTAMGWFTAYVDDIRVITINGTSAAALPPTVGNRVVSVLRDGSIIVLGPTGASPAKLYVWSGSADVADANDDGVLNGTFWVFATNGSAGAAVMSNLSQQGYRLRELRGPVDPLVNDSDRDSVLDGWDGPRDGNLNVWWGDPDADGNVSAADEDSDGDTIPDGIENLNHNETFEQTLDETNAYLNDTDGDGLLDSNDTLPLDLDNDGLTGYLSHAGFAAFGGKEASYTTNVSDPDTDDDGLMDGTEDKNRDGSFDPINETWALDADTDNDGLWDGYNTFWGGSDTVRAEGESATRTGAGATVESDGAASGGQKARLVPSGTLNVTLNVTNPGLYQLNLTAGADYYGSFEANQTPAATENTLLFGSSQIDNGAAYKVSAQNGVTPFGTFMFRLSGTDSGSGNSYAYYKILDVNEYVTSGTHLQWSSFVYQAPTAKGQISIELRLTNGNDVRDVGIMDATGNQLHPAGHNNTAGLWESFDYNLSAVAGLTIDWIAVTYDDAGDSGTATGAFIAYFDNIRIVTPGAFNLAFLPNATTGFRGKSWTVDFDPFSITAGTMANLSLGWFVRLPGNGAAQYNLLIDCQSSTGCYRNLYIDAVNLSRVKYAGELSFGTNASGEDTDSDHVRDGTELGINWAETINDTVAAATGHIRGSSSSFVPDGDNTTVTEPLVTDTDHDGLWDGWQDLNGTGDAINYRGEDYNGNGLADQAATSYFYDSDPTVNDTDGDGLFDLQEYERSNFTNASDWDTDNDLLPDGLEVGITSCGFWTIAGQCIADTNSSSVTDPKNSDTDLDGSSDGAEDNNPRDGNYGPNDFGNPNCAPSWCDDDGDLVSNATEDPDNNGYDQGDPSNRANADTDGDGLKDGFEDANHDGIKQWDETSATNNDTDGDTLLDGVEVTNGSSALRSDSDLDGVGDRYEILWNVDSDGDGSINARDGDSDNDGLSDSMEEKNSDAVYNASTSDIGNMTNPDTDGDGLSDYEDWWADEGGLECTFVKDADNDCLTGYISLGYWFGGQEETNGTDFNLSDTDDDELSDYDEIVTYDALNVNPLDNDTDNDGLFDGTEILGWTFYFSNGATKLFTSNATVVDTDGDGLNDTQEYGDGVTYAGSDPQDNDTDHDGFCDKGTDTCVQDTDNSTFDRTAPLIENVTISVNSTNTGIYYIQVKVSATDLSKLFMIVITFLELAPALKPDPFDEGIDDSAPEMASKSVQKVAPVQVENDAAIVDPEPEGPDVNTAKFRYGYQHPWSVYWNGTGTSKFENFTAVFAIPDRGILTAGFHILVEAMDQQGNINAVEKTHAIEKNFWEKTADKLKEWLDLAGAVARAFLAWLVEAVGPIIGMTLGLLLSIAKNIVDMIFGLPQMIEMMVNHFNEMVDGFGAMFGNLGAVFAAMIDQMITEAEQVLPGAWKQYAKPNATTILQEIIRFFQNPFGFTASNPRMFFAIAWVVGSIVGFVVMNFLGGGAAVIGKLKSLAGIGKVAKDLKGVQAATKASTAATVSSRVTAVASHSGSAAAGGIRRFTTELVESFPALSQKMTLALEKFFKTVAAPLRHKVMQSHRVHLGVHASEGLKGAVKNLDDMGSPMSKLIKAEERRIAHLDAGNLRKAGQAADEADAALHELQTALKALDDPKLLGKQADIFVEGKGFRTDFIAVEKLPGPDGFKKALVAKQAKRLESGGLSGNHWQSKFDDIFKEMDGHIDDLGSNSKKIHLERADYQLQIKYVGEKIPDEQLRQVEKYVTDNKWAQPEIVWGGLA